MKGCLERSRESKKTSSLYVAPNVGPAPTRPFFCLYDGRMMVVGRHCCSLSARIKSQLLSSTRWHVHRKANQSVEIRPVNRHGGARETFSRGPSGKSMIEFFF